METPKIANSEDAQAVNTPAQEAPPAEVKPEAENREPVVPAPEPQDDDAVAHAPKPPTNEELIEEFITERYPSLVPQSRKFSTLIVSMLEIGRASCRERV